MALHLDDLDDETRRHMMNELERDLGLDKLVMSRWPDPLKSVRPI